MDFYRTSQSIALNGRNTADRQKSPINQSINQSINTNQIKKLNDTEKSYMKKCNSFAEKATDDYKSCLYRNTV